MNRWFSIVLFGIGIVSLLICQSCQKNSVESVKLNDLLRVEIASSRSYAQIQTTDQHCSIVVSDSLTTFIHSEAQIHRRGNSTELLPKRSFLIRLLEDEPIADLPAASSWVLLANYYDKTMLRNALAFMMAQSSLLKWTPHSHFVEVWFNSEHRGTYQLCEKVQVHPNRVNIDDDGWLVEVDARANADEPYFTTQYMEYPIRIHYPHSPVSQEQMAAIANVFTQAEEVLFGPNFTDYTEGWRNYLDEQSWIDWYIINEIAKNTDATFFSSCFMHSSGDGRIAIGPVWDYDLAFGNTTFNDTDSPEGWYVRNSNWYFRLFEDPAFVEAVKKRFAYFYNHREDYFQFIRSNALLLRSHAQVNEHIWHTMDRQLWNEPLLTTYDDNIDYLLSWLTARLEWMNNNW